MTIAASRRLRNGSTCFVGIGIPSMAANLARLTHAPEIVLIYESGTIGAKPSVLPLSIGDGELADTADAVVSTPEIFAYWLQGGRVSRVVVAGTISGLNALVRHIREHTRLSDYYIWGFGKLDLSPEVKVFCAVAAFATHVAD